MARPIRSRRPTRSRRQRTFLKPDTSTKQVFTTELANESSRLVRHYLESQRVAKVARRSPGGDRYKKDDVVTECGDKKLANKFLAKHAKKDNTCLVLDGKRARTTKYLLKAGVGSIAIPNNSSAYDSIKKFSDGKSNVETENCSLHSFIKNTRDRYDIIYMDTCGMFTTTDKYDLKASIKKCFYRNLLKDGGIFGVTITSRTNGSITNSVQHCDDWIVEQSGLIKVFSHTYGHMTTMFYK